MKNAEDIRLLTAAINVAVGDWPKSLRLICECIDEAIKQQCSVIAFSELTLGSIDARDLLKGMSNDETYQRLRIIAAYAYKHHPGLTIFIGHPWQGPSADTTVEYPNLPLTKRDKLWNAYSCLSNGNIFGMSLKQELDIYLSRLEERDYIGAKKLGKIKIALPEYSIEAGNIMFPHKNPITGKIVYFYPVIGDQAMKSIMQPLPENCIILNPSATPSTNNVKAQHDQLVQNIKSLNCTYVRINSFGGMNGGQGDILACTSGEMITQILSAPLTEKFCVSINVKEKLVKQTMFTLEELTIRSQARWLFDYLTNANISKVRVVLSLTGDNVSTYHLHLIHCMISWHLESIGLDDLLKKLGYFDEKEKILEESHKTSREKSILQRILTCVYLRQISENLFSENEAQQLVTNIGGKLIALDATSIPTSVINIINSDIKEQELIDNLNELATTVITLGVGNIENGICIANLTLDDLIEHPRFGGKLHRGQISPSSSLYRHQITELLKCITKEKVIFTENDLLRKTIFRYALHAREHYSPLEVFVACQKEACFQQASKQEIFQEIMLFYKHWSKAQYGIHASPLTFNHNQQAIEHNMGMRTPNINAFQRAELAQLALYYYANDEMNERVLVDETWQEILLSFQPINEAGSPIALLKETKCVAWEIIKKQRGMTDAPSLRAQRDNPSENITFKITQASCNQTGGDWAGNMKNIFHAIDVAIENDADFLSLPELALSGYDCGDTFFWMKNKTIQSLLHMLADYAASKNPNLLISVGHPWKLHSDQKHFNVQSLLGRSAKGDARILMMKYKGDLYGEERGFEHRHFSCHLENDITITLPTLSGKPSYTIPFGRKVVARIGNEQQGYFDLFQSICEEYWKRSEYDDGSGKYYGQLNIISEIKNAGYNIGLYVTAHASPPSPEKFEKQKKLTALASCYGAKNMVVIHTDCLGSSGASYVNAGTRYAAQNGKIIVDSEGVYSFQAVSHNTNTYWLPRADLQGPLAHIICPHIFKNHPDSQKSIFPDRWLLQESYELEAAIRNQVLALYETMKKSRVRCFTQALSGGADSAWNVVKIRLMIEWGVKELGVAAFLQSLHYSEEMIKKIIKEKNIIYSIMKHTVLCYYLASKNNSEETENAARHLIENGIGGTFLKFNIQPLIDRFSAILLDSAENKHAFLGITIENIQARIRQMITSFLTKLLSKSPHLISHIAPEAFIANIDIGACFGLSNPNENEGRRGYTTFAGDLHSGEINPNGHLPKDQQLQQMYYIYEHGLNGLQPITSLKYILQQTPSAELQPKNENNQVTQTDEKALGLTFAEATAINHARVEVTDPIKVFESCKNHACFSSTAIATLHDKIYITYYGFPIALHKLTAAPDMQTYGEYTTSAKSSMQYPLISVNERYEIARFTLYCLDKLAIKNNSDFFTLTGYALDACCTQIMLNENFALHLHSAMYTPTTGGRQYKLEILYEKILKREFKFFSLF